MLALCYTSNFCYCFGGSQVLHALADRPSTTCPRAHRASSPQDRSLTANRSLLLCQRRLKNMSPSPPVNFNYRPFGPFLIHLLLALLLYSSDCPMLHTHVYRRFRIFPVSSHQACCIQTDIGHKSRPCQDGVVCQVFPARKRFTSIAQTASTLPCVWDAKPADMSWVESHTHRVTIFADLVGVAILRVPQRKFDLRAKA